MRLAGSRLDTRSGAERSVLRRNRFGFVFQSGRLVPELTAEENVALPLLWSGTRRGPALAQARGDIGQLQSALRGDFEIVARYGEEHPGAWAGAWWDNEPTVRIVAAFTGDAASHGAALRPRLRHPGRLVVASRQHSLSDLRRVREEIERTLICTTS